MSVKDRPDYTGSVTISGPLTPGGNVSAEIQGTVIITGDVSITNAYINIRSEGQVTIPIQGNVNITNASIAVTQSGTWNVNANITNATINVSGTVTVDNIQTGNVTVTGNVNIATQGGQNIIIDKLTQGAWDGRQWETTNYTPDSYRRDFDGRGQFFPRGMRGKIRHVYCYVSNTGTASENLVVRLSPYPGGPCLVSKTVAVSPTTGSLIQVIDWPDTPPMWNYDSLHIYFLWSEAGPDIKLGYNSTAPHYGSTLYFGGNWLADPYGGRLCLSVQMQYASVGDIPVSGTINTINIPNMTSGSIITTGKTAPGGVETELFKIVAGGRMLYSMFRTNNQFTYYEFYVDGVRLNISQVGGGFQQSLWHYYNVWGLRPERPNGQVPIRICNWDTTNNWYVVVYTIPIEFRNELRVTFGTTDGSSTTINDARLYYIKLA